MNIINWFEIPVSDLTRATAFYESVMQVSLRHEKMEGAEMAIFPHQETATGGALVKFDHFSPSAEGCIIYLNTLDLTATLARVTAAGGECVFGPLLLPKGIGTIALFTDSEGNRIGLHQPEA
ncbi:VOC family protein [Scandinavium sp. M-37]|uniref:VOC family protein n=1 Tax=Scandinavium sp. M-37 TaxID=3373077 RepID=UPI0037451112